MKAVMISIRKEHNEKIFSGVKKWEGRKTVPAIVTIWNTLQNDCDYKPSATDVIFYIYDPKSGGGCGKVVGEFVCDFAQSFPRNRAAWSEIAKALCVDIDFVHKYFSKEYGYMIRVCNPVKYDTPKELSEFERKLRCCHFPCSKEYQGKRNACNFFDKNCEHPVAVERPPQSWCYVEELV